MMPCKIARASAYEATISIAIIIRVRRSFSTIT
jgi:hypothetical protein